MRLQHTRRFGEICRQARNRKIAPTQISLTLLLAAFACVANGLQLSPGAVVHQPRLAVRRAVGPSCQFGGGEPPKGLTRENEPEEFFKTNMGAPRRPGARAYSEPRRL